MASGVRCAETTLHSCATPNCSRRCAACCMTSQSLSLPITIPTTGLAMCPLLSGDQLQPDDARNDEAEEQQPQRLARFVEQKHAKDSGSGGTYASPYRIARTE